MKLKVRLGVNPIFKPAMRRGTGQGLMLIFLGPSRSTTGGHKKCRIIVIADGRWRLRSPQLPKIRRISVC